MRSRPAGDPVDLRRSRWFRTSGNGSAATLLSGAIATGRAILAGDRRPRLHRLGLHRDRRGARDRRLQTGDRGDASASLGSNLFTGVYGNYLDESIVNAGLDPDNLPDGEARAMNFILGGASDANGAAVGERSGQGGVAPVAKLVARFEREYLDAKRSLCSEEWRSAPATFDIWACAQARLPPFGEDEGEQPIPERPRPVDTCDGQRGPPPFPPTRGAGANISQFNRIELTADTFVKTPHPNLRQEPFWHRCQQV